MEIDLNGGSSAHSAYKGIRVCIFGAAGFVGRWVARACYEAGATLYIPVRDLESARTIANQYGFTAHILYCDAADSDQVRETLLDIHPAIVFNLAGYGVDRAERDEARAYRINADLVETIAVTMATLSRWNGQSIVHTGSALEYGKATGDLNEGSDPQPTTLYGQSKLAGTKVLAQTAGALSLRAVTARLFTVYGAGEHPGRLLPSLLEASRTGDSVPLTEGKQRRDFTWVGDVADGLLRLGTCDAVHGQVVNLASGRLTSVREFTEMAAGVLGIPQEKLHFGAVATRPEEMAHAEVNTRFIQDLTGWLPSTTIPDGIEQTARFVLKENVLDGKSKQ
jgi:nucleoside-diphosphate-sugar epimerase